MTESRWAHLETCAQMVVGSILAQIILWAFGVQFGKAAALNLVMLCVSYCRTYAIRRAFASWRNK